MKSDVRIEKCLQRLQERGYCWLSGDLNFVLYMYQQLTFIQVKTTDSPTKASVTCYEGASPSTQVK